MVTFGFHDDCIEIQAGTMDVQEFGLYVFGQRSSDVCNIAMWSFAMKVVKLVAL